MKKLHLLTCAALFLTLMSGCSDASADISDGNTVLFKVEGKAITKSNVYDLAKPSVAGDFTSTLVRKSLLDAEVPVTEAMEKEGKETLASAKKNFGSNFESMLKYNNYKDEETYYNEMILANLQTKELTKKYLNEQNKLTEYQPLKVQMIAATSQEKAQQALTAIKNGASFQKAANSYGDTAKSNGDEMILCSASGLPSTVWQEMLNVKKGALSGVIADTSSNVYYVVKVIDTDVEKFKDEALDVLSNVSSITSTAFIFYLEKHEFRVWDIDVYNQIKANNPSYLVQDN